MRPLRPGRRVSQHHSLTHRMKTASSRVVLFLGDDLRVEDCPALSSADDTTQTLVPAFNPAGLPTRITSANPEVLASALLTLKQQLQGLGSDLVILSGPTDVALDELKKNMGGPCTVCTAQEDDGPSASSSGHVAVAVRGKEFDANYRRWANGRVATPMQPAPRSLPPLPPGIRPGSLPTAEELRSALQLFRSVSSGDEVSPRPSSSWDALQSSVEEEDRARPEARLQSALASSGCEPLELLDAYLCQPGLEAQQQRGEGAALEGALERYAQAVEAAPDAAAKAAAAGRLVGEAAEALEGPAMPGASFKALIGPWMEVGAISPRMVAERAAGARLHAALLPQRAAAALRASELQEFHALLRWDTLYLPTQSPFPLLSLTPHCDARFFTQHCRRRPGEAGGGRRCSAEHGAWDFCRFGTIQFI